MVIEEVDNKHRQELVKARFNYDKASDALGTLTGRRTFPYGEFFDDLVDEDDARSKVYSLEAVLTQHIENIEVIEYDCVPQSLVVPRAMRATRPFRDTEKGYRDTVIWLSLLHHLKTSGAKSEVAFITENHTDFFLKGAEKTAFHPDLEVDLKELPRRHKPVKPFKSLSAFVDAEIDKRAHVIRTTDHDHWFKTYLEEQIAKGLEDPRSMLITEMTKWHIQTSTRLFESPREVRLDSKVKVRSFSSIGTSGLSDDEVIVSVTFIVKKLIVAFMVPRAAYLAIASQVERHIEYFMSVEEEETTATVQFQMDGWFQATFVVSGQPTTPW